MKITEKELEDFIFENLNKGRVKNLSECGLSISNIGDPNVEDPMVFYRQFSLGDYGRCDILGLYVEKNKSIGKKFYMSYKIIELKEGEINRDIIFQTLKYKNALEKSICPCDVQDYYGDIVIIGSSISKDVYDLLKLTLQDTFSVYLYKVSISSGISFEIVSDSNFYTQKCCDHDDLINSCDGSCSISLSNGNKLNEELTQLKNIAGIQCE